MVHDGDHSAVLGLFKVAVGDDDAVPYPGDGEHVWSTVHVDDLADLYVRALERAAAGTVYIGASDSYVRVKDLARYVSSRIGLEGRTQPMSVEDLRRRVGPMVELVATPAAFTGDRARAELAWVTRSDPLAIPPARQSLERHGKWKTIESY